MKIIHKLILLVVIGFLGSTSISILGYSRLGSLNDDMHHIMNFTLPLFNTLNDTNVKFLELRLMMRQYVMTETPSERQTLKQKIDDKIEVIQKTLRQYEGLIEDDSDREMYLKAKKNIEIYNIQARKTIAATDNASHEEAINELAKLASIASDVSKTLDDGVHYNEQLARNANIIDTQNYENARWLLLIVSASTIGIIAIIGFLIYRQINHGLNVAQNTISRIQTSLDFTLRAEVNGYDEINTMLRVFNSLVQHLQESLHQILNKIDQVSQTSVQLQYSANRVSEGSNSQNSSTSHMAASVEEMTVSINHVADQAKSTSEQSNNVGRKAKEGQQIIANTVSNIHAIAGAVESAANDIRKLDEKGREIENVISIIRAVAEQTNLLALNAAIEAARAGEQGRGFAVVADEVRSLAARTATSTKEISDMVTAIQTVSNSAVKSMNDAIQKVEQGVAGAGIANETMTEIVDVSTESLALVADISNAIREQGAATNSIAQQVESVAQMVDENSHAASETSEQADLLASISNEMKTIVNSYKL